MEKYQVRLVRVIPREDRSERKQLREWLFSLKDGEKVENMLLHLCDLSGDAKSFRLVIDADGVTLETE